MTSDELRVGSARGRDSSPAAADANLSDHAAMLRNAARLARLGYWVWDHENEHCAYASEDLAAIYGLTPEACEREFADLQRMRRWLHPDDHDAYEHVWLNQAKRGRRYQIDVRVLSRDNGVRYCQEIGEPVFDDDGRLLRTVGTLQDVTEQRTRDEQLAEVMAHSPSVVYAMELSPPYATTFISPNVLQLTGYSPELVLADAGSWTAHMHPDDRREYEATLARLAESGHAIQEYRFQRRDGLYRWFREHLRVRQDRQGRRADAVGYVIDVTERREIEARYRDLFQNAPFGLYRSTPEGQFLEVNPTMAQMFGCTSPSDFMDHYQDISRDFYVAAEAREQIKTDKDQGEHVRDYEYEAWKRDGDRLRISESARANRDENGEVVAYEGCVLDVSERHRAQRALQERVKEIECLHDTSEIRWDGSRSLAEVKQATVNRLPGGFQYPAVCCARLSIGDSVYTSAGFTETPWVLSSDIRIADRPAGRLDVFYTERRPDADDGPFLKEEQNLLDKVAGGLGESIEQRRVRAETEQRAGMLRDAAQLAGLGYWVWDHATDRTIDATEELAAIHGLTREAYLVEIGDSDTMFDWFHPDDRGAYRDTWFTEAKKGRRYEIDLRVLTKHGDVRHCREIGQPVFGDDGELWRTIGTLQDVTEFKAREAELQAATSFLETQRNASPLAILTLDRDARVTSWNPAAEHISGWSADEVMGRVLPIVPRGERKALRARVKRVLNGERVQHFEGPRLRKDGSSFQARIHTAPLPGEDGRAFGIVALYEDVTAQHEAWQALEVSERRFRAVTNLLPIPMLVTEQSSGRLLFANAEAQRMFGLDPERLGQIDWSTYYVNPADRDRIRAEVAKGGRVTGYECPFRGADGQTIWIAMTGEPIEFDGTAAYCVAYQDITERRRMEAQLREHDALIRQTQKMESLGTLAGGIAHDFNNVLQPIVMCTEDAIDIIPSDSPAQQPLRNVLDASERAADLIRQILDFSRDEAPEGEPQDIHVLVKDILRLVERTIPSSVVLESHLDPATGHCPASPSDVTQILTNLAVNASDAMDEKGTLRIALAPEQVAETREAHGMRLAPGLYARLSVEDTGSGMPAWLVERIFEPFFTTKEVGQGTGLGLSVVHGLVRQHDGAVFVATAPDEGTRFDIYLPLRTQQELSEKC